MPGQGGEDLFRQAIDLFSQRVTDYADGIAQRLGQPLSGSQLSQQQVLDRWNFTPLGDPQQADLQYHTLVAQGMPPGQALDQVYPFRKQLIAGPDLNAQIQTAQKIAAWDAQQKGMPKPEPPDPSQLPMGHWAQNVFNQTQPPPQPPPALPMGTVAGPGAAGPAVPGPGVVGAPPPVAPAAPAPGAMPPVATGAMPPVQPVPGLLS